MTSIAIALFAIAASNPQSVSGLARPSPSDIGTALTLERFDDRCEDNASCPMINIWIVQVRKSQCRVAKPAELIEVGVEVKQALLCRFESLARMGSRPSKGHTTWRRDQALMYLTASGWRTAIYLAKRSLEV
jgi:hypothetical protein